MRVAGAPEPTRYVAQVAWSVAKAELHPCFPRIPVANARGLSLSHGTVGVAQTSGLSGVV
jgi:hypothetical protein